MEYVPVVYQLKLTLKDVKPAIWRRIAVRADTSLQKLHKAIQILMDWYEGHLYQFSIDGTAHSPPGDYGTTFGPPHATVSHTLRSIFAEGLKSFHYDYDFGDGWDVIIRLEKLLAETPIPQTVFCLAGSRRGPLEDSGGPYGYMDKLELLKTPNDPEYEDLVDWIPEDFDPEAFDIVKKNLLLAKLDRQRRSTRQSHET